MQPQLIIIGMLAAEERHIKIQIYHELIGNHSFEFTDKNHMSELRLHVTENSPLYIYENFHFQMGGSRLQEYNQLSEIFKSDARLTVVFDPYDHYTSRYHEMRVRQILANPLQWSIVNSHQIGFNLLEDDRETYQAIELDQMFDDPFNSPFLEDDKHESEFAGVLNVSGFNPPPYYRKLQGDLYYLQVHTLEEVDFHVTAGCEGFYVNQSTQNCFNPNQNAKYFGCISLIDLIAQLSPKFKTRFQQIQRNAKVTEFQKILHNFKPILQNRKWLRNTNGWKKANVWRNDGYVEIEKQDFSVVKDWVEIFQFQRACASDSLYQKLGKEKIKYKLYQQFIECAKEGVAKIFKGSLQPINSDHCFEHQVYYHSYLLFYFAADKPQLPSPTNANRELINISAVEPLDTEGVCLSHMIIVNYRGFKIIVRTIPSSFVNGHSSFASVRELFEQNDELQKDQVLTVILKKICKQLAMESQNIITNDKLEQSAIVGHPQIKGCVTKDKKRFIFGLKYLSPRDLNFEGGDQQSLLRPQLMKIYNNKQKCSILYNPLVNTQYILANTQRARLQQKKLQSIAKFAKQIMIPLFIDSFDADMRKYLSDSRGILMNLHKHGLSSKYLGLIYSKAVQKQSFHVQIMIDRVIFVKSAKNLFKKALRETPLFLHNTLIKHLLNCMFFEGIICDGPILNSKNQEDQDSNNAKKGKKKRVKQSQLLFEIALTKPNEKYLTIRQTQFWEDLKSISLSRYKHYLKERACYFQLEFSRTAILRDLCLCLGLQLEKRDYFADHSIGFHEEHILNLIPRVKLIMGESRQLSELIQEGDKFVSKYQIEQAFEAYNRALQYIFSAFGGVHQKLGLINKKIANIYFKIGDPDTAVIFALNSCEVYQKLFGEDHVQTIEAYTITGVYHYARKKFSSAQYFILKAIFLAKFAYSESYPELLAMYLNLSTVYETQRKYTDAIMSIFKALNISFRVFGENHLHTAIVYSALAALHYQIPDIAQAIKYQQKTVQILQKLLGNQDERVTAAKNTCEGYKQLQDSKRIREVHEKEQKNLMGMQTNRNMNFKVPFYEFKDKSAQFFWKKGRKNKYFL